MKKYLALILAVLMLVAAFAGCGKDTDGGKANDPDTGKEDTGNKDEGNKDEGNKDEGNKEEEKDNRYGGTFTSYFTTCPPPLTA